MHTAYFLIVLLAGILPAHAQIGSAGYQYLLDTNNDSATAGFWLSVGFPVHEKVDLMVGFNRSTDTKEETIFDSPVKFRASLITFAGGMQLSNPDEAVTPFFRLYAGREKVTWKANVVCAKLRNPGYCGFYREESGSKSADMIQPGVGLDFHLSETTSIRLAADLTRVFHDPDAFNRLRLTLGLAFDDFL